MSTPPSSAEPKPIEIVGGTPLNKGSAWWQNMEVIGGLTAICLGLIVVLLLAVLAMALVRDDSDSVATIATAAFTLVGTLVGAFFGIKIGTDQAKTAQAQAFAACLDRDSVEQALTDFEQLRPKPPA